MSKTVDRRTNDKRIADGLGAMIVGKVPDAGGGAFGSARMAKAIESLQAHILEDAPAGVPEA